MKTDSVGLLLSSVICMLVSIAAEGQVLEEVVVSATKRAQNIHDIPISVEVLTAEQLNRLAASDITKLSTAVPNLTVMTAPADKNITLRGIGSPAGQRGMEQAVSMYVDGLYKPRSKQYYNSFLDVERVEILRGPQALLFGVNATAGAINIVSASNHPGDKFEGSLKLEHELEFSSNSATAVLGGGLSETLGARLVLKHDDTKGYFTTNSGPGGDEENTSGRLSLVWAASEDLTVNAKIDFHDILFKGNLTEQIDPETEKLRNAYEYNTPALLLTGTLDEPGFKSERYSAVVSADYAIGAHTLTGILSHSTFEHTLGNDFDSGALLPSGEHAMSADSFGFEDFDQTTMELRLASPGTERINYVLGVYAQDSNTADRGASIPTFLQQAGVFQRFGPLFGLSNGPGGEWDIPFGAANLSIDQRSWSIFGNVTFNLSDSFNITLGARYIEEDKFVERSRACGVASDGLNIVHDPDGAGSCARIDAFMRAVGLDGIFFSTVENTSNSGRDIDSNHFLPEISANWNYSDNSMLFARIASGAKTGGLSSSFIVSAAEMQFEDETVVAFEAGIKSRLLNGRAEVNASVFRSEYEDLQVTSITLSGARVSNAGEANIQGIEFAGRFLATDWLTVGGSLSLLDAVYDEHRSAQCNDRPASKLRRNGDGSCDASGLSPPFAADYSFNVYADASVPITDSIVLTAGVSMSGSDGYYTDGTFIEEMRQEKYVMWNAYFGVSALDDRWSLNLIGRNLGNEILVGPGIDLNGAFFTDVIATGGPPSTVTLQAKYNF
jgi:iron complex outermembrane recepter protein